MSIVIALIVVLVVAGLVTKFYPKPISKVEEKPTWDFISQPEPVEVKTPEVVIETPVVETPKVEAPKMAAKPKKKKPQHKIPTKKANA